MHSNSAYGNRRAWAAIAIALSAWPLAAADLACTADTNAPAANATTYLPPGTPFVVPRSSVDPATLPENKRTRANRYLTAEEAGILADGFGDRMLLVDVRTRAELMFNGVADAIDAHVPFLLDPLNAKWNDGQRAFALERNPDFVAAVERRLAAKHLNRGDVVVLICQSGIRAAAAANALADAGFTDVYSVVDGFEGDPAPDGPRKGQRIVNGWRNAGLPWTTKLDKSKMYGVD